VLSQAGQPLSTGKNSAAFTAGGSS
jgi:hypothetical protein